VNRAISKQAVRTIRRWDAQDAPATERRGQAHQQLANAKANTEYTPIRADKVFGTLLAISARFDSAARGVKTALPKKPTITSTTGSCTSEWVASNRSSFQRP